MTLDIALAVAYAALTLSLSVFGLHRAWLLWRFRWSRQVRFEPPREWPSVTVQLPLFNERAVAARAIATLASLDYPRERLHLQVLDDSTDDTREIVEREALRWRAEGRSIEVLRRERRVGFKAGALAEGLARTDSELIAVFDADFVPRAGFLRELVGAFADPRVGMVQARWEHLNRDESAFTRAQAALLDGHFVITHKVRFERGLYFHFNGTAGLWRRAAIEGAGGWQHDTLTEDLDLSYRAQLAGWKLVYAAHVAAPAELPGEVAGFKSQQSRWARGTVQTARKLLGRIWRAPIPLRTRVEATLHFASHAGHPLVLATVALVPFALASSDPTPRLWFTAWLALCTPALWLFYERAQCALGRPLLRRAWDALLAIVLGLGMSWSLSRAAFAGLRHETGAFVRTPKRGGAATRPYRAQLADLPGAELAFAGWAAFGMYEAARVGAWSALAFLALYVLGFGWVGLLSIRAALSERGGREETCERTSTEPASSS